MSKVIEDLEVGAGLDFLLSLAPSREIAEQNIAAAQQHIREIVEGEGAPGLQELEYRKNVLASYLAQARSLMADPRTYDLVLGSKAIPYFKRIGIDLDLLRSVQGIEGRVAKMFTQENAHPEDGLLELTAALLYRRHGFDVAFIEEQPAAATPDMLATRARFGVFAECKRVHPGQYQERERVRVQHLWRRAVPLIERHNLSVFVDAEFRVPTDEIPDDTILDLIVRHALAPEIDHIVDNGQILAKISRANLGALQERVSREYVLANSTQMARLLTGVNRPRANQVSLTRFMPHPDDRRFMDEVGQASLLQWRCTAESSLDAKSRHVLSRLGRANGQLPQGQPGAVHIALSVTNEVDASERQHAKNIAAIDGFDPRGTGLSWVYLNYLLPEISEQTAWSIVETAVSRPLVTCRYPNPLPDSALLVLSDKGGSGVCAWNFPPEDDVYDGPQH